MLKKVINFFKKQNSFRYILLGFVSFILIGSGLLMLPACVNSGVKISYTYLDALFTSASAVTTTGQITVDPGLTYTPLGQAIIAILMQVGGLGITTFGAGLIIAIRRGSSLRERSIIQESFNIESGKGLMSLFKKVFLYTLIIEVTSALLSLISFLNYYKPADAIWISVFHTISAFNNAGFDIFKAYPTISPSVESLIHTGASSMQLFHDDYLLIIVTAFEAIIGGLGFIVLSDILKKRPKHQERLTFHTKVVLLMTVLVLVFGTLIIEFTEYGRKGFTLLDAFFFTAMSTTSGFSTFSVSNVTSAAKFTMVVIMFIGASPGSTAGGIKTTTLFADIVGIIRVTRHKKPHAFHYSLSLSTIHKAMTVTLLSLIVVIISAFSISIIEYQKETIEGFHFINVLFETLGSFSTAGLSSGLIQNPELSEGAKIVLMVTMLIGRVGPLTVASFWQRKNEESYDYAEAALPVG